MMIIRPEIPFSNKWMTAKIRSSKTLLRFFFSFRHSARIYAPACLIFIRHYNCSFLSVIEASSSQNEWFGELPQSKEIPESLRSRHWLWTEWQIPNWLLRPEAIRDKIAKTLGSWRSEGTFKLRTPGRPWVGHSLLKKPAYPIRDGSTPLGMFSCPTLWQAQLWLLIYCLCDNVARQRDNLNNRATNLVLLI